MATTNAVRELRTQMVIDGEFVQSADGDRFDTVNPATGEVLAVVPLGGSQDIDRAVAAARRALDGPWRDARPRDRQRIINRLAELVAENAEELVELDVLDAGGTVTRVRRRADDAVGLLDWYAAQARGIRGETIENSRPQPFFSYTRKEPVGVVGSITPWNAPLTIALWKLGPVLAAGCTMVHKPAEQSPLSAIRLAELCLEAGVPPGVVNVVTGGGEAGARLAAHLDVDKVSFTGSVETGQAIIRASAGNIKRLTMELGGKSPNVIFADADLDVALPAAANAVFGGSGQVCAAGTRLLVERPIFEQVVEVVTKLGAQMSVGDPRDPETDLGPLISAEQVDRVLGYVASGAAEGARLRSGGSRPTDAACAHGYFVSPTVFTDAEPGMRIFSEEIFGPVLVAVPFDAFDEAMSLANATRYGLAAGIWTSNMSVANRAAAAIRSGTVWINTYSQLDPAVPMGGYRMSGYGRELGHEQIDEYLQVKSVWMPA